MRVFLRYIFILLCCTIVSALVLDSIFTLIYHKGAHRNKLMWVRDMQEGLSLDYVLLGSSRVNYTIQPTLIELNTGEKGYNLGMNATNIVETMALFEQLLKNNTPKKVFVQVDIQYVKVTPDPIGEIPWMPYMHQTEVYNHFKPFGQSYAYYKYIPFYRYQKFAGRLGFREVTSAVLGSGYDYEYSGGFMELAGTLTKEDPFTSVVLISEENNYYQNLINLCKKKNIEVFFFTAPYYNFEGNIDQLDAFLPNYTNFSDAILQRELFSDNIHLNVEGATRFTEIFIKTYFSEAH